MNPPPKLPLKSLKNEVRLVVYISGPVTGKVDGNRNAFMEVEDELFDLGYSVENPRRNKLPGFFNVDIDSPDPMMWSYQMKKAVKQMMECHAVIFLDDWLDSRGARIEYYLAKIVGIECYDREFRPIKVEIDDPTILVKDHL